MPDLSELFAQARRLRFAPVTETRFRDEYRESTQKAIRFSFMLAPLIYASFSGLDFLSLPETHRFALTLRLAVVCPMLGLIFAGTFSPRFYRHIQPIMVLAAMATGAAINAVIAQSHPGELGFEHYYVGLILVMWFVSSFIRLLFWHAMLANVAILAFYELASVAGQGLLGSEEGRVFFISTNFFLVSATAIGACTCYWLELAARREFVQRLALEAEKARSDRLLLNILPEVIVERMKNVGDLIADEFPGVSVLFADLVNFTKLASEVSPQRLVAMLNELFSAFDALVEKHGLEKIKTIGDCYMVASGVPTPRQDHAAALVDFALDMREHLARPDVNQGILAIRIGISSGPVVAGVIGTKKFIYDLWGDTVNTASRMESHGTPGQIQINRATYELVEELFSLESLGVKSVKGKGETEVWQVLGRR